MNVLHAMQINLENMIRVQKNVFVKMDILIMDLINCVFLAIILVRNVLQMLLHAHLVNLLPFGL